MMIRECEMSLARKEAYYSLEHLYNFSKKTYINNKLVLCFPYRELFTSSELAYILDLNK